MTLTLHQNAEKLLSVLKELPSANPGSVDSEFRETVKELCLQVREVPLLSPDPDPRLIVPPFPG
jgi:hypothetical protein